jgi:hypothetical protein
MLGRICPTPLYLTTGGSRRFWEAGRANDQVDPLSHFITGNTWASCNESWDIHLALYAYQREDQQRWNYTIAARTQAVRSVLISTVAVSAAVKHGGCISIVIQ